MGLYCCDKYIECSSVHKMHVECKLEDWSLVSSPKTVHCKL